ncbi:4a-hydroxytetrahydrobiopterin dehydratase [Endozoicomonas sp. Mp262]|uniref:4a-hydroxytetrahydrobiopterin dehydratase n=1 Tax=Endozoicomonas sp. Mp262 TaxID=2919499 RepID=UPI0021D9313F
MSDWQPCRYNQIDHIEKTYTFKKYSSALAYANAIAALAEFHNHHPRLVLEWGRVTIAWGTHQSKEGSGVFSKDRALAKACDKLFETLACQL